MVQHPTDQHSQVRGQSQKRKEHTGAIGSRPKDKDWKKNLRNLEEYGKRIEIGKENKEQIIWEKNKKRNNRISHHQDINQLKHSETTHQRPVMLCLNRRTSLHLLYIWSCKKLISKEKTSNERCWTGATIDLQPQNAGHCRKNKAEEEWHACIKTFRLCFSQICHKKQISKQLKLNTGTIRRALRTSGQRWHLGRGKMSINMRQKNKINNGFLSSRGYFKAFTVEKVCNLDMSCKCQ